MAEMFRYIAILMILSAALFSASLMSPGFTGFYGTNVSGGGTTLVVWDDTDSYHGGPYTRYTYPTSYETYQPKCYMNKDYEDHNVYFFANYTDNTESPITDASGDCDVRFDENDDSTYEAWVDMSYNATSELWEQNRSFNYKGDLNWQVLCTSSTHDNLSLTDNMTIENTGPPCIFTLDAGGYIQSVTCYEDIPCNYDFSANVIDDDFNDVLTYSCLSGCFSEFSINPSTGVWTVLVESESGTGDKTVNLKLNDSDGSTNTALQNITINPVNDAPEFGTLPTGATEDLEFNSSSPEAVITATDEEGDYPLNFTINITNCTKAHWIKGPWRNNCSLFSWNQTSGTSVEILNFTPTNWDVGTYTVNYTVRDCGNTTLPYNATYSVETSFTVTNVNDEPNITAINGTSITLNQNDLLYVIFNGTDIENDTLSFNATTLYQNLTPYTNTSLFPIAKNDTNYPNESAYGIMNYTLTNAQVGNYTLNITLTDNGTNPDNLTDSILVNFTIYNVNDPPALENLTDNLTAIQGEDFYYDANASDPDMLTIYNDSLTFNFTFTNDCSKLGGGDCNSHDPGSIFSINETTGLIHINAMRNDTGNYTMNLTVTDSVGLVNWSLINLTITPDWAPVIEPVGPQNGTQNEIFYLAFNITERDNDTMFINVTTLYRNLTIFPNPNLFPVNISNSSVPTNNLTMNLTMNYTLNNSQVGNYTIMVIATDKPWNRTSTTYFNITVENINDPPQIINFTSCYNESEIYPLDLEIYENIYYCLRLHNPDPDLLVPRYFYWENLTYNLTYEECNASDDFFPSGNCSGKTQIAMNITMGIIDFTAENETWHGNYTYNLTIFDSKNATATKTINITIYPANDGPVLDKLALTNESGNETYYDFPINETIVLMEGITYNLSVNATDEEENTPFYYNASFACTAADCDLFTLNHITGKTNFTPDTSNVGNYTANFTATDSGNATFGYDNATGWELVNLTVKKKWNVPYIETLHPEGWDYTASEGSPKGFNYKAYDLDNETLNCTWYLDGKVIRGLSQTMDYVPDCNCTTTGSWPYNVSYDDAFNYSAGINRTVTLIVVDPGGLNASKDVNITFFHVNRAPRFNQDIDSPIKWTSYTSVTPINLSTHFEDDAWETLEFTYIGATNIDVVISEESNVTLTPKGSWYGTDWIVFVANDSEYNATSNNVTLIVEYKAPKTKPTPVTRYQYRPKVVSLRIIVPEIVTVDIGKSSRAKVILYNDGDYNLHNINLTASTNETNITLALEDTFIDKIEIGENVTTWLNMGIGDLDVNQTYLAQVLADVGSPPLQESATITIQVIPTNKTIAETEIVMVKDLFEENPECMELFGLIVQAEESLDKGDIAEARRLTKLAMDHCHDMIDYAKLKRNETGLLQPSTVGQIFLNPIFVMGFAVAVLVLAMLGFWLMSRRQTTPMSQTV